MLSTIQQIANLRDERKDETVDILTRLHLLYKKSQKVATPTQDADVVELRWRVTNSKRVQDVKELQLQTLPDLAQGIATLQLKAKKMHTATTRLKSDSDAVLIIMDKIWRLFNKTIGVIAKKTNLTERELELEVE